MDHSTEFDAALIRRYDKAGPRYTSYPTAVQFHDRFGAADFQAQARASNEGGRPLSLYVHIPFCAHVCYYCACNKVVTRKRERARPYLERLAREIELAGQLFDASRPVVQLHWGGGTPTYLDDDQIAWLMAETGRHFHLLGDDEDHEYSIEIDPREIRPTTMACLRGLGFNRISLGVQDFSPRVQEAVHRIQPEELTRDTVEAARREGFSSISFDLIYGLPFQSVASFSRTLDVAIDMGPDRLSVFNYAHLPELFKPQRRIDAATLPSPAEKLDILALTIEKLTAAGYVFIGMDHFARPDDELAVAQRDGTLTRNFQGYSTHAGCDLVGLGVSAISMVGDGYSQNAKTLDDYYAALDDGRLPVVRGVLTDEDDRLRREVITRLICHFRLDMDDVARRFGIDFGDYFSAELAELDAMAADGLLIRDEREITVTPKGRLLIRNICMVFDKYLREAREQRFSKVI